MALGAQSFPSVSTGFSSDSKSMLPTVSTNVGQVPKMSMTDSMQEVFSDIRDGIITTVIAIDDLGSIFSSKISGLNSHLAFRLETLNSTLTTIGKVLKKDFSLDEKTFDEMKEDQEEEDRNKSLGGKEKEKEDKSPSLIGSIFSDLKAGFSSIIDFLTPKSDLMKVGLAGLLVAAVFVFQDKIEEVFTKIFTYLGSLKDAFKEGGFKGLGNKIQKDIRENIINPTLASVGIRVKEDGTLGLVQGSFLDKVNPFGGPTNIFKTLNAFRTGINPYDNNSKMYPEWYYKGFMENLDDLLTPEDPDMLVNAINGMIDFVSKSISGFFFGAEKTMPGVGTFREQSGISKMKDQMMENFRNNMQSISDFFHDEDGNLFGIDFKALTDLLPTIQEIAESIIMSLPKFLRPNTLEEKNIDKNFKELKQNSEFYDPEVFGKSVINREFINEVPVDQLKALLAKDSDDLKPADIRFIENKIAEKELVQKMIVNKDSVIKTNTLTKTIEQKDSLKSNGATTVNVVDTSNKSNVSNYSSRTDQIVEMRDGTLEMTAFEMNNFFRTR